MSPFVLDIRSLGRRAGTMTQVHRTVSCDHAIGLDLIGIPAESDIDLDLKLEAVTEGVLVTGTVSGETAGQCARCLEPLGGTVTVFLTELYAYPDSTTDQTSDADDIHRISDDHIDLEQAVIDAVALDLPMAPLCRPDCAGLCSECGVRLDAAGPDHGHEVIDPRWAALKDLATADGPGETGDDTAGDGPGSGR
ncbi:YceD family protein [Williamsia serinedens]|uniref:Metal-binding protein n=1 Tax=Williamsia serinedens TaxID=391736 RepID=A0ABT1GW01_9NOCA|nr:DUF177 domain-containing protein [Williamsia serinedens]MCP2158934.1 uncharacterized protein [Williamsia serinedens]